MSDPRTSPESPPSYWQTVVIPTAIGLEAFFWRLAWFGLLVACLYCCCNSNHPAVQGDRHEDRTSPAVGDQAVSQQPAGER